MGLYRPRANENDVAGSSEEQYQKLMKTKKFKPDRDFEGVDRSMPSTTQRGEPVQFVKDDPFGLDDLMSEAREGRKTLSGIGKVRRTTSSLLLLLLCSLATSWTHGSSPLLSSSFFFPPSLLLMTQGGSMNAIAGGSSAADLSARAPTGG